MKHRAAIDEICDERAMGNGWFVYLKPGWHYNGQHCFGEDRKRDIAATMEFVKPCTCDECRELNARNATQPQVY